MINEILSNYIIWSIHHSNYPSLYFRLRILNNLISTWKVSSEYKLRMIKIIESNVSKETSRSAVSLSSRVISTKPSQT